MSDFWCDIPGMTQRLSDVQRRMRDTLRSERFPLADAVEAPIDANGKMLRPAFLLLAGDFGKKKAALVELAAAVELLHVATLIHDDVIDEAATRRGTPTVHARYSAKDAVLAGDWLFSRCFRLAAEASSPDNAKLLARLVGGICSAEIHQDLEKFAWPESVRNYLRKIAGKTALLFALAVQAGARESKASFRASATLSRIGYDVGMAFQIIDDILDYESSEGAMRKPVGKDICEGLCTLPLILALRADGRAIRPLLVSCRPDDAAVKALVARVRDSGALAESRDYARRYTERALREVERLPKGPARDAFRLVVRKLLDRRY